MNEINIALCDTPQVMLTNTGINSPSRDDFIGNHFSTNKTHTYENWLCRELNVRATLRKALSV